MTTTTQYAPPPGPPPALHTGVAYAPPPGPPPKTYAPPPAVYPSCQDTTELSVYIRNSLTLLAARGWLSVPLPPDLEPVYAQLFAQSASFFDLPSDAQEKLTFAAPAGKSASDEGFADIPGEKQLITLRRVSGTPARLQSAATDAWDATGKIFLETVRGIADSLDLDLDVFDDMSCESRKFSETQRASSLLRLFRYNRPGLDEDGRRREKKVVAEGHKDLGIITLVVGHSPGLDARDPVSGQWISVEDTPHGTGTPKLTATLLAGQTLSYLTQGLYTSGVHRVSVLPSQTPEDKYRFSLVFALRPSPTALIDTAKFEQSPLIGKFPPARLSVQDNNFPNCSMYNQSASELFRCISQQHWNVNIAPEIREEQKKQIVALVGEKPEEKRLG
ncbi:hypothetical protein C8J57DRAFT_1719878 [Mycena rebaudengoi]|nr:hypothetical protein C8J57DRAFT_1372928 [Mycena rebaudengoi]KAJ7261139.1 hypothetical protein C8J57DRAFT_1719878 [Mycena rebaudengoi]